MGLRVPDAGADLVPGGVRLWVGCEAPHNGPAYHVVAAPDELLTLDEWQQLEKLLHQSDESGVVALLNSSSARGWWARAVPVLRHAWQTIAAAHTLWRASTAPGATQWVGPSPVWSP